MDWVTFLVVVMLLLLLLCSLQSEMGQLEEQVDQQAHKIQRYKVYREYMERVLEHSGEVIIIYCILGVDVRVVNYACFLYNGCNKSSLSQA